MFSLSGSPVIKCQLYYLFLVGPSVIERQSPSVPVLLLSFICVIALMLPTNHDERVGTSIPSYLHLSVNQKLIAAFVLGENHFCYVSLYRLNCLQRCVVYTSYVW